MTEEEVKTMNEDQVWEYVRDCVATLKILKDSESPKFEPVHKDFSRDIELLYKLGCIDEDAYNELKEEQILRFDS